MGRPIPNSEVTKMHRERVSGMREAGIRIVEIMGCNHPPDECEALRAVVGQQMEIEFCPDLPLPGCDKQFCKCIALAKG